jgi:retron-type reverse transcriptase
MVDLDYFLSYDNFALAWQRILRSQHYSTKDQLGLRVYEANLSANLTHLIHQVKRGVYRPSTSKKVYLPKKAGTVRSLPVLSIDDRLVYQAVVNIVAANSKMAFEAATGNQVFAHLAADTNSPYMLQRWDGRSGQYSKYLARFRGLVQAGNRWLVEADVASYYDTIDHEMLCAALRDFWLSTVDVIELLGECLRAWTPHDNGAHFSRGLPQGYEASDYLASLFLFDVDKTMIQRGHYLRYADDIRILAPDRDSARRLLLELDMALKRHALILQPNKTGAKEIEDVNKEVDNLISRLSLMEQNRRHGRNISPDAEALFFESWDSLARNDHAEAHLVFALGRIPVSKPSSTIAISMLQKMPWRSSIVNSYLSKFSGDTDVIAALKHELESHKVYAWHLANCMRALASIADIDEIRPLCREWISNTDLRWYQRLAAIQGLQRDKESYNFLLLRYESEDDLLLRTALIFAAVLAAPTNDDRAVIIRKGLRDSEAQVRATAVWLFLEFPGCGIKTEELGPELGLHRSMVPEYSDLVPHSRGYIEYCLENKFNVRIPVDLDLQAVFSPDYDHAEHHLRRALRYRDTDPDAFVTAIDNFNQFIAIKMSEVIDGRYIPRDEYANILGSLSRNHSIVSAHFQHCHNLRSQSRGPHAWATSLKSWSEAVTHRRKEQVISHLRVAYQLVIDAFETHVNGLSVGPSVSTVPNSATNST